MTDVILKRFEKPDETRVFEKGKFELIEIGGLTIGRATYEPGWKWSEHVGKAMGAAIIVDTVSRLVPGALGNAASAQQESFTTQAGKGPARGENEPPSSTCGSGGLLDYPHYTRPAEFRGMPVPEVLVNGNHDEIRRWRRRQALQKTLTNRPDLLREAALSREDRKLLEEMEGKE